MRRARPLALGGALLLLGGCGAPPAGDPSTRSPAPDGEPCQLPAQCQSRSCGAGRCGPRRALAFAPPTDLAAGMPLGHPGYPSVQAIAAGDLDGDGARDLAVPSAEGVAVTILFGDGHGGLAERQRLPTKGRPTAAVAADLDGDGRDELILGYDGSVLSVVRGGPRPLGAPIDLAWADSTSSLAVADLTGDGLLDVVAAPLTGASVTLGRGDGRGGFAPAVAYPLGVSAYFLSVGDLDGDGLADLAVSEPWQQLDLFVATGRPADPLAPRGQYTMAGATVDATAIADLDHDGRAEMVVAHSDGLRLLGGLPALRGLGDLVLAGHTDATLAVDLDLDGNLDLALARDAEGLVQVLLGDGALGFPGGLELPVVGRAVGLQAVDLDGDGLLDLVAAQGMAGKDGPSGGLRIFLNRSR